MSEIEQHLITDVIAHPITHRLPTPTETSWGRYEYVSILLVEIRTDTGLVGVGESLARFSPLAYAHLLETALAPRLIGQNALAIDENWARMRRALSGRTGGMLFETIAGVDIALWDILGKSAGLPISKLIDKKALNRVPVYAASVHWGADQARAINDAIQYAEQGFKRMKVKIGGTPSEACKRIAAIRSALGDDVELSADANWAFSLDEAIAVADALADNGYVWFEEPLRPEDEQGYRILAQRSNVPLAAGESNYTLDQATALVHDKTLAYLQPNITRAGGISETLKMAKYAAKHDVAYAPHVGMSGIICEAASLHVAAASPNISVMECPLTANLFKSDLADLAAGAARVENGSVPVPSGSGLGLTINWDAVAEMENLARKVAV